MNDQIYREQILEHYHNPLNTAPLDKVTHKAKVANYSCGDEIELSLEIENNIIKGISHNTTGCAIAIASASILSDYMKGKSLDSMENINKNTILKLVGIELTPSRLKCALLPLEAVRKALLEPN